jgi:hypothetical protein
VQQPITSYHQDENGDWVADLACGHGFHLRHNPPWLIREWVQTEAGRNGFIGRLLNCRKCEESDEDSKSHRPL